MKAALFTPLALFAVVASCMPTSNSNALIPRRLFCGVNTDSPQNYCWEGYKGKDFRGTSQHNCVEGQYCCGSMATTWETTALFSAKVTKGCKIKMFTDVYCAKNGQIIDSAGYRDMSSLPAYNSWAPEC
ncbi:Hypothetical protein R9X50_00101900 [Acrodontium crateriforme]|uniref:Secreted protein n=1 Tax=Acrodontium crateriforme TaxID=150365 RepID=A0AAQ3M4B1_9PEZI|nr:Hypothetical protein R9X50_00101900 [Acrodontium crateriforme]